MNAEQATLSCKRQFTLGLECDKMIQFAVMIFVCAQILPTQAQATIQNQANPKKPLLDLRPTLPQQNKPAVQHPQPTSQITKRLDKKSLEKKSQITTQKETKKKGNPWLIRTRIPFGVTLLGGLTSMIAGLVLFNQEQFAANIFLSVGTSVVFSTVSSYMWWNPSPYLGVLGTLLGVTSLVGGIAITAGAFPKLSIELGIGLLSSTLVHFVFNLVGWMNLSKLVRSFKQHKQGQNPAIVPFPDKASERTKVDVNVSIVPYIDSKKVGISCFVSF